MNPEIKPILSRMARAIDLLFGDLPWTYQVFVKNEASKAQPSWGIHHSGEDIETTLKKLTRANRAGAEIAVVPNPMTEGGRKKGDCQRIRFLFADFDSGKDTRDDLRSLPVKPHLIVETSPGRFHVYWKVRGVAVAEFAALQAAIAKKLGSDASITDPCRCMRLAGTVNLKHQDPFLARIVYPGKGAKKLAAQIAKEDFCAAMGIDLDAEPVDEPKPSKKSKLTEADVDQLLKQIGTEDRNVWLKVGMALHSKWPDEKGYDKWTAWSKTSVKFNDKDQRKTWDAFKSDGKTKLGTLVHLAKGTDNQGLPDPDESSFSSAIVRICAGKLGFDSEANCWWRFDGTRWIKLTNATQTLKPIRDVVEGWKRSHGAEAVKALDKVALMTLAQKRAALEPELALDTAPFDKDPALLGVPNGVVDLRTGVHRPATPADNITLQTAVPYDANAKCPAFLAFLDRMCRGDKSLQKYLLRFLGYCLTGETKEQTIFMLVGTGGNGKGLLTNTVGALLGKYAVSLTPRELTNMNSGAGGAANPAVLRLEGKRLLHSTELMKGRPLDEAFVKQLSGGDKLSGRQLYEGNYREFKVAGKLVLLCNDPPQIAYGADAMWRRIKAIPCDAKLTDSKQDKELEATLASEAAGILALLVVEARSYYEDGLRKSDAVDQATQALRERSDYAKAWVENCCREVKGEMYPAEKAHESYRKFVAGIKAEALSPQAFKAAMERLGYQRVRRGVGNYYAGIRPLNK